ncbi:MAG: DUF4390 domain-containing protein [Candidatus Zixiibacteriota bacterium]
MIWRVISPVVALVLVGFQSIAADAEPPVGYQLLVRHGWVVAMPDLSPLLTSENVSRLKGGIGLVFDYRLSLKTPRRLFGARTVAEASSALQISYRLLTDEFLICRPTNPADSGRTCGALEALADYLADSLVARMANIDSLSENNVYRLDLDVTSILLTDIRLIAGGGTREEDHEPLEYLFRQFLSLTGYGQEEWHFQSRQFHLSDLAREP